MEATSIYENNIVAIFRYLRIINRCEMGAMSTNFAISLWGPTLLG